MGYFKLFHHIDNEIQFIFSDSLSQGEGPGTLKRAAVTVEASRIAMAREQSVHPCWQRDIWRDEILPS